MVQTNANVCHVHGLNELIVKVFILLKLSTDLKQSLSK